MPSAFVLNCSTHTATDDSLLFLPEGSAFPSSHLPLATLTHTRLNCNGHWQAKLAYCDLGWRLLWSTISKLPFKAKVNEAFFIEKNLGLKGRAKEWSERGGNKISSQTPAVSCSPAFLHVFTGLEHDWVQYLSISRTKNEAIKDMTSTATTCA